MRCGQESCTCEGDDFEDDDGEYCCEACAELAEAAAAPDEPRAAEPSPPGRPCPCAHPGCQGAQPA